MNDQISEVKVLLADDHSIVRHAIRTIIETVKGYNIVGEAENADRTIQLVQELKPDLLILDLGLPGKSGLEAIYELKQHQSPVKIIVLTMYEEEEKVRQALAAGASAYLLKNSSSREFLDALDAVRRGEIFLSKRFEHLKDTVGTDRLPDTSNDPLHKLSQREREVFYMLADGMPNRVIAKKLFISSRTVETHRARVIKKLGFNSTADLIRFAIRNNLLSL